MKPVTDERRFLVEDDLLIPVTGDGDDEEQATQAAGEVSKETLTESASDEVKQPAEDFATKYKELQAKYESDLGKLKSSLQKREGELVKEKSALEKKLDELLQSTMDDEDKKQYQHEKLMEELETIRQERDELKVQNEQVMQFTTWRDYFVDAGVPKSELKLDEGLEGLFQSGMEAMRNRIKALEEWKTKPVEQKPKGKEPPEVAASAKGKLPTLTTLDEAIKHFASGDEEKFWRMAEIGNQQVLQVLNELNNK